MSEQRPVLAPPIPGHMYVDSNVDGQVVFTSISQTDDLTSTVIWMTPATAARLGQWLIDVASRIEKPT